MKKQYDFIIVGAGFFGSTFARIATDTGYKCLIIEKRNHIGGNAYTQKIDDIDVHCYGPHIFHTNDSDIWNFVNRFTEFNNYIHCPKAKRNGKIYSLPFNMNTFNQIWGVFTPKQAQDIIYSQIENNQSTNLEEHALSMVGRDIYELLIKEYTRKQWQRDPKNLPSDIIKRLPLRWTYDDRYFNDKFQGIPVNGYTSMFEKMLDNIHIELNVDFISDKQYFMNQTKYVIYTGAIDEFFDYKYGALDYRTLKFETEILETENYQGTSVINSCDPETSYTRTIEHRHFKNCKSKKSVITREIPIPWNIGEIPYYPINDNKNNYLYNLYRNEADTISNVIFGGRLAEYRYYDMHQVIGSAMKKAKEIL